MVPENEYSALELMQARVAFVPEQWSFDLIGKVLEIRNNLRRPINEGERGINPGPFPYYGPTKIQGYIGSYEQDGSYVLIGEDGDHFLKYRDQPMTQLVDGKCTVNNHAHIIAESKTVTREWFYYYFMHRDIFSFLSRQGAGRFKLNKASLERIPLLTPPLPEQRKIAKILQTWDRAIAATEKLIDASKQQKKALMQQLLTGKKRFAGFEGDFSVREGFVQKKLGKLPEYWALQRIAKHYWFQEGPGVRNHQFTESGVKLFNGTNIQKSRINLENTRTHISEEEGYGPYAHFLAEDGDLVIACSGISVDRFDEKIAFLEKSHLPLCMNTSTMRFKVNSSCIATASIEYLRYFLMSSLFKNQIRRQITGSAQLNFGPSHVAKCFIPMPSLVEQRKIAQALSAADNKIDQIELKLARLRQEKKALMQQLLTGKRRVKVDD
ncbi:restriction endonuclease subunit S [Granulosicoccus antarcticus]|uniref:Type I restriction modification DNA specificity domain-containing protein n=1 Tax=Granulosicoccus antarcticus IMCC3135 TaxID=1192854 RepID=A0A2Z2NYG1_9GAMM|nr:restriction endonuclease subunit S [Granulosicoccus antarcticus]ASJ72807.1 hypothetical protein IMCC3135_13610 [Granulosicoccus antarcticus IMCC3135]